MSTTNIYRLGRDPEEIGETRNAWRGAMYVWNDIAKRYCGLSGFPSYDEAAQKKVWNAHVCTSMPEHEIIVLMTTMDFAAVYGRDVRAVADAFDKYAADHPNCSLGEQAEILRTADIQPDDLIGWLQTSVSEFWGQDWDNSEADDPTWYDPATNKHFDAYASAVEASNRTMEGAGASQNNP